jgi:alkylation response protein AidB-like acyl-CoA dehydrogenase
MDFQFSEDQRAFADTAAALFADYCGDDQLRAHDQSGQPFMQDLWKQCVASGLHAMLVPEPQGGLGLGFAELMAVLEAQGRALALVPLWEHQLAASVLARFGQGDQAAHWVAQAASGEIMLGLSLAATSASRGAGLRAEPVEDGWRVTGLAPAVPLGAQSDVVLLLAQVEGVLRPIALQTQVLRRVEALSQHHLGLADLHADGLIVPREAVLPAQALDWAEPRAIAALAALQLGVTTQQLARTVAYVSERQQFGRAIGSFQLVAGQMADGQIAVEALRSSLWQLAYRIDAGLGTLPQALALRAMACDTAHRAGHMAQHVHGGMGVDITYPIHRFLYWSRALGTVQGGTEAHLARLGDWLADNDNLGWKYDLPEDL